MPGAEIALQRIDISALLWRLRLLGVDVGERFGSLRRRLADGARGRALRLQRPARRAGAASAPAGSTRPRAVLGRGPGTVPGAPTVGAMSPDVGVPLMTGLLDYGRGRYDDAVERCCGRARRAATASAAAMRSAT